MMKQSVIIRADLTNKKVGYYVGYLKWLLLIFWILILQKLRVIITDGNLREMYAIDKCLKKSSINSKG